MGKWTDKMYITHKEWCQDFGGARRKRSPGVRDGDREDYFADLCQLTFKRTEASCCTAKGGLLFDRGAIEAYLLQNGAAAANPITKEPLRVDELLDFHFYTNAQGLPYCPITLKTFTPHSTIVVSRAGRRAYSLEGLRRLHMRDYETDAVLADADLVVLQDPLRHAASAAKAEPEPEAAAGERPANTAAGHLSNFSTGRVAASLTSTSMTPVLVQERRVLSPLEVLFAKVSSHGAAAHATVRTNRGDLHFELWPRDAPWCVYNFVGLAREGYYAGCAFHRLLPGFMVQGGDPTGTGKGGKSVYGKPFFEPQDSNRRSHNARGVLSMASHPNRHRSADVASSYVCLSQFLITFAPCEHLDGVHPPFGRLLHGWGVLDAIEACTEARAVVVEDVIVVDEPFREAQAAIDAASQRDSRPGDGRIATGGGGSTIGKYLPKK